MKPFFGYYGGKQRIARHIIREFDFVAHSQFCVPFVGGGGILFNKLPPSAYRGAYAEVINDKNDLLINFYRQAQLNPEELFKMLDASLYSESNHRKANEIIKTGDLSDPLLAAWAFYISITHSFASQVNGSFARCSKVTDTFYNNKKRFKACVERIEKIIVGSQDALDFIKSWDKKWTLFYCDPPYPDTSQGHYSGYKQKDFEGLIDLIENSKASFILSCYDNHAIPEHWVKKEFTAFVSASADPGKRRYSKECIWIVNRSP